MTGITLQVFYATMPWSRSEPLEVTHSFNASAEEPVEESSNTQHDQAPLLSAQSLDITTLNTYLGQIDPPTNYQGFTLNTVHSTIEYGGVSGEAYRELEGEGEGGLRIIVFPATNILLLRDRICGPSPVYPATNTTTPVYVPLRSACDPKTATQTITFISNESTPLSPIHNYPCDHLPYPTAFSLDLPIPTLTLLITTVLSVLATLVFLSFINTHSSTSKTIKLSQPLFCKIFLLSAILTHLTNLSQLGSNTFLSCALRVWGFHLCFTMGFGALVVKILRVYMLFRHCAPNPSSSTIEPKSSARGLGSMRSIQENHADVDPALPNIAPPLLSVIYGKTPSERGKAIIPSTITNPSTFAAGSIKKMKITNKQMVAAISLLLLIDFVILTLITVLSPASFDPQTIFTPYTNLVAIPTTICPRELTIGFKVLLAYKLLLLALGAVAARLNRGLDETLSESLSMNRALLNAFALFFGYIMLDTLLNTGNSNTVQYTMNFCGLITVRCVCVSWSIMSSTIGIFRPKVISVRAEVVEGVTKADEKAKKEEQRSLIRRVGLKSIDMTKEPDERTSEPPVTITNVVTSEPPVTITDVAASKLRKGSGKKIFPCNNTPFPGRSPDCKADVDSDEKRRGSFSLKNSAEALILDGDVMGGLAKLLEASKSFGGTMIVARKRSRSISEGIMRLGGGCKISDIEAPADETFGLVSLRDVVDIERGGSGGNDEFSPREAIGPGGFVRGTGMTQFTPTGRGMSLEFYDPGVEMGNGNLGGGGGGSDSVCEYGIRID